MTLLEENQELWRMIGRCEHYLKCRKRGPPRRDRPSGADTSCRARVPNETSLWCDTCRLLADIDRLMKGQHK